VHGLLSGHKTLRGLEVVILGKAAHFRPWPTRQLSIVPGIFMAAAVRSPEFPERLSGRGGYACLEPSGPLVGKRTAPRWGRNCSFGPEQLARM
jgi:hypothetical protein